MLLLLLTRGEWVALLCAVTAMLFASPLLRNRSHWEFLFHCDDGTNFITNPILQRDFLFSYENLYTMATTRKISVYEPLSWLLKALIVQSVGLDSWAIRVVTLVLHFAAGLVLTRVSVLLIELNNLLCKVSTHNNKGPADVHEPIQTDTIPESTKHEDPQRCRYVLGCCLSTLLYLVHPINVEVIGWASAQPYTLSAVFANLALLRYLQALRLYLQRNNRDAGDLPFLKRGSRRSDWVVAGMTNCLLNMYCTRYPNLCLY